MSAWLLSWIIMTVKFYNTVPRFALRLPNLSGTLFGATTLYTTTFNVETLSIMTLSRIINKMQHWALWLIVYAECNWCWVSLTLSVTNKPFMLSVALLSVVMLSVVAPSFQFPLLLSSVLDRWNLWTSSIKLFCVSDSRYIVV